MLVDQYVEALLRDERLTDAVWELWNAGLLADAEAASLWGQIAGVVGLEYRTPQAEANTDILPSCIWEIFGK